MQTSRCDFLRWQFVLVWSLLEYHLERLEPEDHLWEPAAHCWTVRLSADGSWAPDWADTEPVPIPVPTIAWLTWHIGWWWSTAIDHVQGRSPRSRTEIQWPGDGDAAISWLRELRTGWVAILGRLTDDDLDTVAPYPWPDDAGLGLGHTLAWVNAELMKNAAEIGQLRVLRAAHG